LLATAGEGVRTDDKVSMCCFPALAYAPSISAPELAFKSFNSNPYPCAADSITGLGQIGLNFSQSQLC
jgi:hypothetical protein